MKTTQQWWDEVSNDETKMIDWLKDQYHGEVSAHARIKNLVKEYNLAGVNKSLIKRIAEEERVHAVWVGGLLTSRGVVPEVLKKEERYWDKTLPKEAVTFEYICAVGHHAEVMRLERIDLLRSDKRFVDIANVFSMIYPDEVFHAKAFAFMSTEENIEKARKNHEDGLNALGLVI